MMGDMESAVATASPSTPTGVPSSLQETLESDHNKDIASTSKSGTDLLSGLDDAVIQEALESGVDLKDYSAQVEGRLKGVEREAVADYIAEAERLAALHRQIADCDSVLETIEHILTGFQTDLNSVTADIRLLQEQSILLDQRLKNRQAARGELSQYVDDLVISETMIRSILEAPVTERDFLEQLHELNHKITFVKAQQYREAKACDDVASVVDNLKLKAIEKIREFLLLKINMFKKPLANYQVPQNAMLKYRFFYEFLLANERQIAKEVRDEYVDTVAKVYCSYFKTYAGRLFRLQHADAATKEDLLGHEDTARLPGLFAMKPALRSRATVFSIGERINVLTTDLEGPLIVPHSATERYHMEALFRCIQYALVEHASHEYLFLTDFFLVSGQTALQLFGSILGKAIGAVMKSMEEVTPHNNDAVALLLCVQIAHKYMALMGRRKVPALDGYWTALLGVLSTRFEFVMHQHIESVRMADAKKLGGTIDTRPHYIVRRYAEFCSSLLLACHYGGTMDDRCQALITRLQAEIEAMLGRLATELKTEKEQAICLVNNYDLILSVLTERLNDETKETASFKELLQVHIGSYIEEVLRPHFGALQQFVKECEPLVDEGKTELLKRYVGKAPSIVSSFNSGWKKSVEQLNQEIMLSFTNFKNGTSILQDAFTTLVQYYHRFNKVMSQPVFSDSPAKKDIINIHTVVVELKKHKPQF